MTRAPSTSFTGLRFSKMHGLGNDFVVVDCRERAFPLDTASIRTLADRHFGIGFDQLLTVESTQDPSCLFAYRIWNADGSSALQCGNGVRCVAAWLQRAGALKSDNVRLQGPAGVINVELLPSGLVRVDMGEPRFAPADIPLNQAQEKNYYSIVVQGVDIEFSAVSIGNPHVVIEVDDVRTAPIELWGPLLEHADIFPQRCNVGFAKIHAGDRISLRVWERGVGETLACGSGACAAMVVLRRNKRVDAQVSVELPGGILTIGWEGPGHPVWMTGPAVFVFEGEIA